MYDAACLLFTKLRATVFLSFHVKTLFRDVDYNVGGV